MRQRSAASAFAYGFEKGLTTAMLRPEWAQAFYRRSTGFHPKACLPVVMVTTMELKRKLDPTLAPNSPALVA